MNKIQKRGLKTIIILGITMVFMSCMWLIDLGSSALGSEFYAQTLTTTWTPNEIYHIGLIGGIICFYLILCFLIYEYFIQENSYG